LAAHNIVPFWILLFIPNGVSMVWSCLDSSKVQVSDRPQPESEPVGDLQLSLIREILTWKSVENLKEHQKRGEEIWQTYERLLMLIWAVKNSDGKQALESERDATVGILRYCRG
jgi:hypothetical protein